MVWAHHSMVLRFTFPTKSPDYLNCGSSWLPLTQHLLCALQMAWPELEGAAVLIPSTRACAAHQANKTLQWVPGWWWWWLNCSVLLLYFFLHGFKRLGVCKSLAVFDGLCGLWRHIAWQKLKDKIGNGKILSIKGKPYGHSMEWTH